MEDAMLSRRILKCLPRCSKAELIAICLELDHRAHELWCDGNGLFHEVGRHKNQPARLFKASCDYLERSEMTIRVSDDALLDIIAEREGRADV